MVRKPLLVGLNSGPKPCIKGYDVAVGVIVGVAVSVGVPVGVGVGGGSELISGASLGSWNVSTLRAATQTVVPLTQQS